MASRDPTVPSSGPPRPIADGQRWMIRDARPGDAELLARMLAAAADWRATTGLRSRADVLAEPGVGHYVAGWSRPGDVGIVAEVGRPLGAAWYRFLPPTDPGYGYVDTDVPELTVGVADDHRGQGIGRTLLTSLLDRAAAARVARVSLSVEDGNPARRLYERLGFVPVGRTGTSMTMIRVLARGPVAADPLESTP